MELEDHIIFKCVLCELKFIKPRKDKFGLIYELWEDHFNLTHKLGAADPVENFTIKECGLCNQKFTLSNDLWNHLTIDHDHYHGEHFYGEHLANISFSPKCKICEAEFINEKPLGDHSMFNHEIVEQEL